MSLLNKLRPLVLAAGLAGLTSGCTDQSIPQTPQEGIIVDYEFKGEKHRVRVPNTFFKASFTQQTLSQYDPRFFDMSVWYIRDMFEAGISPEEANSYSPHFSIEGIRKLHEHKITPAMANIYDERFFAWEVVDLCEKSITPEIANSFKPLGRNFTNATNIIVFLGQGITSNIAASYFPNFKSPEDILALHKAGITPEQAAPYVALNARYGTRLDGADISGLIAERIPFEEVEAAAKQYKILQAMK